MDKFSVSVAVAFLRFFDQRCFSFRVVNCQFLFLSIFHLLNEIYVRFIRKLGKSVASNITNFSKKGQPPDERLAFWSGLSIKIFPIPLEQELVEEFFHVGVALFGNSFGC